MELKSIYNITSFESTDNEIAATIKFYGEHKVFEGHFPGNPIVPGVVQIQIIKDLLEKVTEGKLFLNKTKSVKFLNIINPDKTGSVLFEIKFDKEGEKNYKVKCIVKKGSLVFLKYSGNALLLSES